MNSTASSGLVAAAPRMGRHVEIAHLGKVFRSGKNAVRVLDDLSLDVDEGEMLVLLGPSGCGKTTLLRCLVGLEQADEGTVRLVGRTVVDAAGGVFVPAERRGVGMVFQNYALWPHMTVARNVEYPLRARGLTDAIAAGRVREVLDIVQCGHLMDRYPPQLSGGQQQRVALARALGSRPKVMLLDEPLSNLDALLRIELRAQLRQLHRKFGFTGIYVTHDQVEAMNLATRVVVMKEGRIEQIGAPMAIFTRPANEYVAEFLGMRNRIDCEIAAGGGMTIAGSAVASPPSGAPGRYAIRARPSELTIRATTNGGATEGTVWLSGGTVVDVMLGGETTDYIVDLRGTPLFVETRRGRPLVKDQPVDVGLASSDFIFFEADGTLAAFSPRGRQ